MTFDTSSGDKLKTSYWNYDECYNDEKVPIPTGHVIFDYVISW